MDINDHDLESRLEDTIRKSHELIEQTKKLVQETEQLVQKWREERLAVCVTCDMDEHYSSLFLIRR